MHFNFIFSGLTSRFRYRAIASAGLAIFAFASHLKASTGPGSERFRHHLEILEDAGLTNTLATTWPIAHGELSETLSTLSKQELTAPQLQAIDFLQNHIDSDFKSKTTLQYGSDLEQLRGFAEDFREQGEIRYQFTDQAGPVTLHLAVAAVDNPIDQKNVRLDGSYLSIDWGHWRLGAGQVDRWWGPGWQGSLILSNNARPSPGVFIDRTATRPFDLPLLRRLGPWTFSAFANQLESERHVPHAKLLGARFAFKPLKSLEIGLNRTAQWGGEGRPETLSSLKDLIIGNDNVGDSGIELDGSNEPGNQLGGFDLRWTTRIGDRSLTLYGQLVGEDEAGGLPSRKIGLFGIEMPITTNSTHGRIYLEASDTTMDFLGDRFENATYNHHIYQSGYRYYGQAIGASTDNDSRLLTLGGIHEIGSEYSVTWKAQYADLNRDGSDGNNSITSSRQNTAILSAKLERKINEQLRVGLSATHIFEAISDKPGLSDTSIQVALTLLN